MSQYFPKPLRSFGENINVKNDLSDYTTKTDLKNISQVDTSSFSLKTNLASLKTKVGKLDISKLAPVSVDLNKLAAKVNNIDTSDFVLKTKYQTDKTELKNKIPDMADFVEKTKLTELEDKIPDVSSLATKTPLTAVENKIPSVSSLGKKTNYDTKVTEIEKNFLIMIMTSILLLQSLIL